MLLLKQLQFETADQYHIEKKSDNIPRLLSFQAEASCLLFTLQHLCILMIG